jgi:hypothetical protein
MKKLALLLLTFSCVALFSQKPPVPTPITPISSIPAFQQGEEINYELHYGFIKAGEASITLGKEVFGERTDIFHARAQAKTTGVANKLFRVLDIYESFFDIRSNLPYKSIRNIREGNYKYYNEVYFDHYENTVKSQKSGVHKVPANMHDMLSAFFYVRRVDFTQYKGGEIVSVDTYFGDEVFPFYIIFKGREEISTSMGKFKCLRFVPIVEPGRIFKESDDMTFWLSDDENKVPVSVKFDMIVGSFKCDLVSFKNPKFELKSKIK